MTAHRPICAVVPIKDSTQAKQRLAVILSADQRRQLALVMMEDVLATLVSVSELAGIVVVTVDPAAAAIAKRHGAQLTTEGALDGQTGAVMAAAHRLASQGMSMIALPGDIPLVEPADILQLLSAHQAANPFTIAPAHDQKGSNAVLCSPADAVPLRFGENSFFPHLAAARAQGIEPRIVHLPRIALDLDAPQDLALFRRFPSRTRAHALIDRWAIGDKDLLAAGEKVGV